MKSLLAGLVNPSAGGRDFLEPPNPLFHKTFALFFGPVLRAVTVSKTGCDFDADRRADSANHDRPSDLQREVGRNDVVNNV